MRLPARPHWKWVISHRPISARLTSDKWHTKFINEHQSSGSPALAQTQCLSRSLVGFLIKNTTNRSENFR